MRWGFRYTNNNNLSDDTWMGHTHRSNHVLLPLVPWLSHEPTQRTSAEGHSNILHSFTLCCRHLQNDLRSQHCYWDTEVLWTKHRYSGHENSSNSPKNKTLVSPNQTCDLSKFSWWPDCAIVRVHHWGILFLVLWNTLLHTPQTLMWPLCKLGWVSSRRSYFTFHWWSVLICKITSKECNVWC